ISTRKLRQDKGCRIRDFVVRIDAKPQSWEVLCAQSPDHRLQSVMAAGTAAASDAHLPKWKGQIVSHCENVGRTQAVPRNQSTHCNAAQVHERLRLCQQHFDLPDRRSQSERLALTLFDLTPGPLSQSVNDHKPAVVAGPFIMLAWIPQASNQKH